ncbi:MAG: PilZ domain-containing protein, partial [Spirochaetes bacterium]|nr:PilZ domain-containing protein [Spirochaetota bacterium]
MELKRRKYIRHPLNYPLTTRIISQEKHAGEVSGESHNIGAGGLLFISDKGMPEGSEVEIELKVEKRSFKLDGNV